MSETPTWLTNDNKNAGVDNSFEMTSGVTPAAPATAPAAASATGGSMVADGSTTPAAEEKDLPGIILTMRLANMGVAIALVACSILLMVTIPTPDKFVLAIYATCGGLLICCLETQLKFLRVIIAVNFGFLFNSGWRFLFYMILASVSWSYQTLFGKIVAGCLGGCAIFNTYILCRYPSYRRIREKIAEEEDKRIEARISKEVKRQAVNQVMAPN